jgi:protein involved in sex pheromone biosynthesis
MKKTSLILLVITGVSILLAGCGEKVNTDIDSVNKGKGEQVTVESRTRSGEAGGR